jgi:antiviral helicase SLH1
MNKKLKFSCSFCFVCVISFVLPAPLNLKVQELTGEVTPDLAALRMSNVLIVTPEKWDSISRGWARREYVQKVSLMIIDEIHLLGVDRGPVLVSTKYTD